MRSARPRFKCPLLVLKPGVDENECAAGVVMSMPASVRDVALRA